MIGLLVQSGGERTRLPDGGAADSLSLSLHNIKYKKKVIWSSWNKGKNLPPSSQGRKKKKKRERGSIRRNNIELERFRRSDHLDLTRPEFCCVPSLFCAAAGEPARLLLPAARVLCTNDEETLAMSPWQPTNVVRCRKFLSSFFVVVGRNGDF